MKKIAVISASGGMDSTALLLNLLTNKYKVYAISFYYGQKHKLELSRLKNNVSYFKDKGYDVDHKIVDISDIMKSFYSALTTKDFKVPEGHYEEESMKQTVVPNRNAIFSSLIYGYALSLATKEKSEILMALGVHSGDHAIYPDCRPEFYEKIYDAFVSGNWDGEKVKLYLPYLKFDKEVILRDALISCKELNLDFDLVFANTNTSYDPDEFGRASGKTGSDIERILAFHAIGIKDPVQYVGGWKNALNHALKVEKLNK